nr:hypothetical protein GCM10017745_48580 [Saccharothrix mutabilis subsp. capreolus]
MPIPPVPPIKAITRSAPGSAAPVRYAVSASNCRRRPVNNLGGAGSCRGGPAVPGRATPASNAGSLANTWWCNRRNAGPGSLPSSSANRVRMR